MLDGQTTCTVYIYFVTPEFINNWFFFFIFFVILRNFHILVYNSTLHNRQYAHLFLLVSCQSSTVASNLNKLFCWLVIYIRIQNCSFLKTVIVYCNLHLQKKPHSVTILFVNYFTFFLLMSETNFCKHGSGFHFLRYYTINLGNGGYLSLVFPFKQEKQQQNNNNYKKN